MIEKPQRWRGGPDLFHGHTDKENTDKKSEEIQASIRGVHVWAAGSGSQLSKGVRKRWFAV